MDNLKECDYVIETYVDEYKTLCQSIMYEYEDYQHQDFLRTQINPNLNHLVSIKYFKRDEDGDKLIYEEKIHRR